MTSAFPPLKNDLLLRAARGEETERAPVWVMRQAGRYLPEFHEVRAHHSFFEVCRTPALSMELTLQPIRRYAGLIDAAIIFSDILVVPQAMGMEVQMNPGPYFPDPLVTPADVEKLTKHVDVDKELGYVYEAITITRKALDGQVPLIGFCGAPWTLFSYMIEGGGTKTFQKSKTWLFKYPEESKALLMRIADVCVDFLVGQIKAGAQLVQVFDSWAGELAPHDFEQFSLPYLKHIATNVRSKLAAAQIPAVPMTLFPKGANTALASLAEHAGYDVIGIDWCIEPSEARRLVSDKVALQGNMDPNVLYGGKDAIEREAKRMCEGFKGGKSVKGWIANLGHGITPGRPGRPPLVLRMCAQILD
ncbi:Uroporphyrinogen decarboxylase [Grifola frondosa]|uniref:Uroporphyrinogen decarboxylase n=1 Tax=Grifola frondosa TaxID=5627 RepID=A0A1C7M6D4_GRIFR|nr:Uroporphyrinogen decarboxylase [Grifola frondosa]